MAEAKRAYYIQLYFDVMDDPLIAKMRKTWRWEFLNLMVRAIKSEEPGVILLEVPDLAQAAGMRLDTFETMLDEFERKRLIGFRKSDHALVIARRLLPQLEGSAQPELETPTLCRPPRKKFPSDFARRSAKSPSAPEETEPLLSEGVERAPENTFSPSMQRFFEGAPNTPAESNAESCGGDAESPQNSQSEPNKEEKKKSQSQSPPHPPVAESSAEQGGQALGRAGQGRASFASLSREDTEARQDLEARLLGQGVKAHNAQQIAQSAELDIANALAQIDALSYRNASDPPGLLVKAIREKLPLPQEYLTALAEREKQTAEAEAQRKRQEEGWRAADLALQKLAEREGRKGNGYVSVGG